MTAHPASLIPFEELIRGLEEEVAAGYIKKSVRAPPPDADYPVPILTLYNYTPKCTFAKHWNRFTLVARGLIVSDTRIIAYPFPKFFNHGEEGAPKGEGSITSITEKMDGSLGIIFHYSGEWQVATRGSFDSTQSKWAKQHLPQSLQPGITYLVEIIYPENKVVIDYQEEKLVLLGAFDLHGKEIMNLSSLQTGLPLVTIHSFLELAELKFLCQTLPGDREGFVVCFSDGIRLKYKGLKYLELHRNLSGCTPLRIWDALRKCQDIRQSLPEEFYREYDWISSDLLRKFSEKVESIIHLVRRAGSLSSKEVSLGDTFTQAEKVAIFIGRRPHFIRELNIPGKVRNGLFDMIRPT